MNIKSNSAPISIFEDAPRHFPDTPFEKKYIDALNKTILQRKAFLRHLGIYETLISKYATAKPEILEVASGFGFSSLHLAAKGYKMSALDIYKDFCELTCAIAKSNNINLKVINGDACNMPIESSSYDFVFSKSFFEHVYDVDKAISEQIRVLKPGGILVIEDGNLLNPKLLLDLLFFYPIRSKGQYGGFKWLFGKHKLKENLYGMLKLGRDEDAKTQFWWKRKINKFRSLKLIKATTTAEYLHSNKHSFMWPFVGACLIIAQKN